VEAENLKALHESMHLAASAHLTAWMLMYTATRIRQFNVSTIEQPPLKFLCHAMPALTALPHSNTGKTKLVRRHCFETFTPHHASIDEPPTTTQISRRFQLKDFQAGPWGRSFSHFLKNTHKAAPQLFLQN